MKLECISLSLTRKMIDGTERYRLRVDPSDVRFPDIHSYAIGNCRQLALSFFSSSSITSR